MQFDEYFKTPVYMENLPHWVDDINKKCEKHLKAIKNTKKFKERVKKKKWHCMVGWEWWKRINL